MSLGLRVAVCQMTSVDDIDQNLSSMLASIAALEPSDKETLVCFPENCLYLRCKEGEVIAGIDIDHPAILSLARLAKEKKYWLHLGALPLKYENGLFNSSVIIDSTGAVKAGYRKMHLFDIQLENAKAIKESDVFGYGYAPECFEIGDWKIGQSICYDIRFSELYSQYARQEVDVILIPSSFLVKTGQAHWEVLNRARAIESQAYVVSSAQGGNHIGKSGDKKETYGHSLVVDPWGRVQLDMELESGVRTVTIEKEVIVSVRKQIPMRNHRRRELNGGL